MEQPPFRGRRPFAAGDDLTDESMFATVRALGGIAARVGPYDAGSAASVHIAAPASLRAWLAALE
jgi:trehalose 6-phosphate phosphatase